MKTIVFPLLLGLGGVAAAAPAAPLRLTLVSAKLERVKLKAHDHSVAPVDARSCLTQPGVRARLGESCGTVQPSDGPALNPVVRVEYGGAMVESYAVPRSAAPRWDFDADLDAAALARARFVDVVLLDRHAGGGGEDLLLGGKRLALRDFLRPGTRRLKIAGGELTYRINRDTPPEAPRRGKAAVGVANLQQVIDAHDADIQSCVSAAADPSGELVLLFTIAADGSAMGVTVERSSPNLGQAAGCIRQKALRWRYPASTGVLSARYPMRFSTN